MCGEYAGILISDYNETNGKYAGIIISDYNGEYAGIIISDVRVPLKQMYVKILVPDPGMAMVSTNATLSLQLDCGLGVFMSGRL